MRFRYILVIVAISSLLGVCATAEKIKGCDSYNGVVNYYSAPQVAYYRQSAPAYDSRTTYYAPATSQAYSRSSVHYLQPPYCEPSDTYKRPGGSEYSSAQPIPGTPTTIVNVGAYENRFAPQTLKVQPGTTVRWTNHGQHTHTVTSNDGRWDSGDIKPGATYSATFKHPGTYYYYCRHHTADKMQGVIVVGPATSNGNGGTKSSGY
jgi:plastocyanin